MVLFSVFDEGLQDFEQLLAMIARLVEDGLGRSVIAEVELLQNGV